MYHRSGMIGHINVATMEIGLQMQSRDWSVDQSRVWTS